MAQTLEEREGPDLGLSLIVGRATASWVRAGGLCRKVLSKGWLSFRPTCSQDVLVNKQARVHEWVGWSRG